MTDTTPSGTAAAGMSSGSAIRWTPLIALGTAQFVMVLDQSVMNVSISTLVAEFDTTVTTIQAVITLYCLVMAMFMMTGAKVGTTQPQVRRRTPVGGRWLGDDGAQLAGRLRR